MRKRGKTGGQKRDERGAKRHKRGGKKGNERGRKGKRRKTVQCKAEKDRRNKRKSL